MKKTGLVLAAAAAALFVAGCASQGTPTGSQCAPAPVVQPAACCKGAVSCKGKSCCKGKKTRCGDQIQ